MISDSELVVLLKSTARIVRDFFDKQSVPMQARIDTLEAHVRELDARLREREKRDDERAQ